MSYAITTISTNGQVVIPSNIRKDAKIAPHTKFLIISNGQTIYLKQLTKEKLEEEIAFATRLERAERQIKEGKYGVIESKMTTEEMHKQLMKKKSK